MIHESFYVLTCKKMSITTIKISLEIQYHDLICENPSSKTMVD